MDYIFGILVVFALCNAVIGALMLREILNPLPPPPAPHYEKD